MIESISFEFNGIFTTVVREGEQPAWKLFESTASFFHSFKDPTTFFLTQNVYFLYKKSFCFWSLFLLHFSSYYFYIEKLF